MDARFICILYSFPDFIDIALRGARQPGDRWNFIVRIAWLSFAHFLCDPADSLQIIRGSSGKPGFDDVHAEARQVVSQLQFFGGGHGCAR